MKIKKEGNKKEASLNSKLSGLNKPERWKYFTGLIFIVIIILVSYWPSLRNGFVWDDGSYIQGNPLIQTINFKNIFSSFAIGNYHPITMLMHAVEYKLFGLNAGGYHFVNLIFHILNTLLVYYVILLISGKNIIAFTTAILFGIHPLHVESVAWASELKNLLYTFFFLASYYCFILYQENRKGKYYFYALILFLFSLLSKAMAVSLPVLFLLTDYFKYKKIDKKSVLEKIPYFILSIILGVVAIIAQQSSGATEKVIFPFTQRIIFAVYGFMGYLSKLVFPIHLSGYYPYPIKSGDAVPATYYGYLVLFLGLMAIIYYSLRFSRKIIFGLGFFSITVFLVLQLLPVGGAIMADRYSYVPSIGIFYLCGELFYWIWNRYKFKEYNKIFLVIIFGMILIFYSQETYSRCKVWENGLTFWNNVIDQFNEAPIAFLNRGISLNEQGKYNESINDFAKTISLKPDIVEAYINRGGVYIIIGKYDLAIKDFQQAISIRPDFGGAYANLGLVMVRMGKFDEANNYFNKAIEVEPGYVASYYDRGNFLMNIKKYDEALKDFNKAIEIQPGYSDVYSSRGNLYCLMQKYEEAEKDFDKALEIDPNRIDAYINKAILLEQSNRNEESRKCYDRAIQIQPGNSELYCNRGIVFEKIKMNDEAIQDYTQAIYLDPKSYNAYYNRGNLYINLNKNDEALADMNKVIELKSDYSDAYILRGSVLMNMKQYDKALLDFTTAIQLNPGSYKAFNGRGNLLMGFQKYELAMNDFSSSIKLNPDYAEAYGSRGSIYGILGKYNEALDDMNKAIVSDPNSAKNYFNRGVIFKNTKKFKEAIGDLSKAIALQPDYAKAYFIRGNIEFESGDKNAACADLQKANQLGLQQAGEIYNKVCQ